MVGGGSERADFQSFSTGTIPTRYFLSPGMRDGALGLEICFWKLENQAKALEEQAFPLLGVWTCRAKDGPSVDPKSSWCHDTS